MTPSQSCETFLCRSPGDQAFLLLRHESKILSATLSHLHCLQRHQRGRLVSSSLPGADPSARSPPLLSNLSLEARTTPPSTSRRQTLKNRKGDQRGGSEWEPIKILLQELDLNPKITSKDTHTNLSRSNSHSGPTDLRNKFRTKTPKEHTSKLSGKNHGTLSN